MLLLSLFAACGEEKTAAIKPAIVLESADGAPIETLGFGEWPITTTLERTFVIRSGSSALLKVASIESDPPGAVYVAEPKSLDVPPLGTQTVKVWFTPAEVTAYPASLVIRSNDPDDPEVRLALTGQGIASDLEVFGCLPATEEDPDRCADTLVRPPDSLSLGEVVAGGHAQALVTLSNKGGQALQVERVAFASPEAAATAGFSLPENAGQGFSIGRLSNATLQVDFNPPAAPLGAASATIVVTTTSLLTPEVRFELVATVVPNTAPEACLRIAEVRPAGEAPIVVDPGAELPEIEPTDVVVFETYLREGCSGDAEDGDDVTLDFTVDGPDPRLAVESVQGEPTRRSLRVELSGSYVVSLQVTDKLDLSSTTDAAGVPAEVAFDVLPRTDIAVEAGWDQPFVDLDLHFVKSEGGTGNLWHPQLDAYWKTTPDWGTPAVSRDDPKLVLDDQGEGALAETLVLDEPEAGELYNVYVHLYEDRRQRSAVPACTTTENCNGGDVCSVGRCLPPVQVQLQLFLESQPVLGDFSVSLEQPCDLWFAGWIVWPQPGGLPEFVSFGDVGVEGTPQTDGKCLLE